LRELDLIAWQAFRLLVTAHVLWLAWVVLFGGRQAPVLAQVEGVVQDGRGRGVAAAIEVWPTVGPPYRAVSDAVGVFRVVLPPGQYRVVVERCAQWLPPVPMMIEVRAVALVRLPILEVPGCSPLRKLPPEGHGDLVLVGFVE
jgi:hypothetical protein